MNPESNKKSGNKDSGPFTEIKRNPLIGTLQVKIPTGNQFLRPNIKRRSSFIMIEKEITSIVIFVQVNPSFKGEILITIV